MASGSRNIRYHRVNWEFFITPGVKLLLVANCAVYLLQVFIYYFRSPQTEYRFDLWFGLVPSGVIPGLRI